MLFRSQHLILLKSEKPSETELSIKVMTNEGLVDEAFSDFVLNKPFSSWMIKKSDCTYFEDGVDIEILGKVASSIQ